MVLAFSRIGFFSIKEVNPLVSLRLNKSVLTSFAGFRLVWIKLRVLQARS